MKMTGKKVAVLQLLLLGLVYCRPRTDEGKQSGMEKADQVFKRLADEVKDLTAQLQVIKKQIMMQKENDDEEIDQKDEEVEIKRDEKSHKSVAVEGNGDVLDQKKIEDNFIGAVKDIEDKNPAKILDYVQEVNSVQNVKDSVKDVDVSAKDLDPKKLINVNKDIESAKDIGSDKVPLHFNDLDNVDTDLSALEPDLGADLDFVPKYSVDNAWFEINKQERKEENMSTRMKDPASAVSKKKAKKADKKSAKPKDEEEYERKSLDLGADLDVVPNHLSVDNAWVEINNKQKERKEEEMPTRMKDPARAVATKAVQKKSKKKAAKKATKKIEGKDQEGAPELRNDMRSVTNEVHSIRKNFDEIKHAYFDQHHVDEMAREKLKTVRMDVTGLKEELQQMKKKKDVSSAEDTSALMDMVRSSLDETNNAVNDLKMYVADQQADAPKAEKDENDDSNDNVEAWLKETEQPEDEEEFMQGLDFNGDVEILE